MERLKHSTLVIFIFAGVLCTNMKAACSESSTIALNVAAHKKFIDASCKVTLYPEVCVESLSTYFNKIKSRHSKLVSASLSLSLKRGKNTFSTVLKLLRSSSKLERKEIAAVKDCVYNILDSVEQIAQSLAELEKLNVTDFDFKMSNVMTWVSAALSNEDTCLNGLQEGSVDAEVQEIIKNKVLKFARLTSNALAFVNRLDVSHLLT